MSFMRIEMATIRVPDYRSLLAAWRGHGGQRTIVSRFIVEKPLTKAQLRRLPKGLKSRLQVRDSLDFLERLYELPDSRGL
jgi:hypothetical protein